MPVPDDREGREELLTALDERLSQGLADVRLGRTDDADRVFDRLIAIYELRAASSSFGH